MNEQGNEGLYAWSRSMACEAATKMSAATARMNRDLMDTFGQVNPEVHTAQPFVGWVDERVVCPEPRPTPCLLTGPSIGTANPFNLVTKNRDAKCTYKMNR
jgi:hypothetical protein